MNRACRGGTSQRGGIIKNVGNRMLSVAPVSHCDTPARPLAHAAFYAGARGVLRVLAHLAEHGKDEELRGIADSSAQE